MPRAYGLLLSLRSGIATPLSRMLTPRLPCSGSSSAGLAACGIVLATMLCRGIITREPPSLGVS